MEVLVARRRLENGRWERAINPGRKAFAASTVPTKPQLPGDPGADDEHARRGPSLASADRESRCSRAPETPCPNWVIPLPLAACSFDTLKIECLSE